MVDLYKTDEFAARAKKLRISDRTLCKIAKLHREKLAAGDKNGGIGKSLFKVRISTGGGKSGGARSVLASAMGSDVFFIYCYPKSEVSDNAPKELDDDVIAGFEHEAATLLHMDATLKANAVLNGIIIKVECDGLC